MNPDTIHLIERPYQEVVDDLLTALVGGVVNEPIEFDLKADAYRLAEPAKDIRSVTGTKDEARHTFLKEIDFLYREGDNALVWEGGDRPDDRTRFYVDYYRRDSRSPLTDLTVGSVVRTIAEAIGREIATVYAQIDQAYLSAFLETAKGKSLDLVVSILGLVRKTKESAAGLVTFFRAPTVLGAISIPQALPLAVSEGPARFETTQPRTLQAGQTRIDVPVRAAAGSGGEKGIVPAGAITIMLQPLAGIDRITNFEPTVRASEDESDDELRGRARAAIAALGGGTRAAVEQAIRELGARPVEFRDPNGPAEQSSPPGTFSVLIDAEPERFGGLAAGVGDVRAAGVLSTLVARYVYFRPRIVAKVAAGLSGAAKEKVKAQALAALEAYVASLSAGQNAKAGELLAALSPVSEISDARFRDVLAWRSELSGASAGVRMPDRDRIVGPGGARATDAEIEAGTFEISPQVDGESWWVSLDMSPADLLLQEA
ncbi:MAG TPA: baseplate J/gp47 family protein [Thermoanaerobaculia bacterium]|jgi:hypothetical protein|nr:baseplate J/gp47 family protein [Thermoanaerobaculia bacterium]